MHPEAHIAPEPTGVRPALCRLYSDFFRLGLKDVKSAYTFLYLLKVYSRSDASPSRYDSAAQEKSRGLGLAQPAYVGLKATVSKLAFQYRSYATYKCQICSPRALDRT